LREAQFCRRHLRLATTGTGSGKPDGDWLEALPGFYFDLLLISLGFEGGPGFFDPVFVWITLIRGRAVCACSEA